MANRFFVMHFDLSTAKKLPLRITLTNLVTKPKVGVCTPRVKNKALTTDGDMMPTLPTEIFLGKDVAARCLRKGLERIPMLHRCGLA